VRGNNAKFVPAATGFLPLVAVTGTAVLLLLLNSVSASAAGLPLRAEAKADRVSVFVGDKLFTEYLYTAEDKYPYFYPVNGPRTGKTVTTRREKEYPHHSSIFFGCDRVNGGNYWQEGLERGRIVSKQVKVIRSEGPAIELEQDCVWERPNAAPPFDDHRRIRITAPSADTRCLDFEVSLTARNKVRIEKTNHSLFSARVAPEISVKSGGTLRNANGDLAEKGTFGKPAPWADYRGKLDGETEGIAIFVHPKNRWSPAPWFTRDYGFMSPTPMQWLDQGFVEFAPGETLRLRYRVIVHAGNPAPAQLETWYQEWVKE
jgi:hypothetical protein